MTCLILKMICRAQQVSDAQLLVPKAHCRYCLPLLFLAAE